MPREDRKVPAQPKKDPPPVVRMRVLTRILGGCPLTCGGGKLLPVRTSAMILCAGRVDVSMVPIFQEGLLAGVSTVLFMFKNFNEE